MTRQRPLDRIDAGLPERGEVVRVLHNSAARQTLLELKLPDAPPRHRLYCRVANSAVYQLIGTPSVTESFESVVTCEAPRAFFTVVEWRHSTQGWGGLSKGLSCVELGETPAVTHLDTSDVLPPNGTIRSVLRVADAGDRVDVVATLKDGSAEKFVVRYAICRLDLQRRRIEQLDELPGVFF